MCRRACVSTTIRVDGILGRPERTVARIVGAGHQMSASRRPRRSAPPEYGRARQVEAVEHGPGALGRVAEGYRARRSACWPGTSTGSTTRLCAGASGGQVAEKRIATTWLWGSSISERLYRVGFAARTAGRRSKSPKLPGDSVTTANVRDRSASAVQHPAGGEQARDQCRAASPTARPAAASNMPRRRIQARTSPRCAPRPCGARFRESAAPPCTTAPNTGRARRQQRKGGEGRQEHGLEARLRGGLGDQFVHRGDAVKRDVAIGLGECSRSAAINRVGSPAVRIVSVGEAMTAAKTEGSIAGRVSGKVLPLDAPAMPTICVRMLDDAITEAGRERFPTGPPGRIARECLVDDDTGAAVVPSCAVNARPARWDRSVSTYRE